MICKPGSQRSVYYLKPTPTPPQIKSSSNGACTWDAHVLAAKAIFSDASVYNESTAGTVMGDPTDAADLATTFGSVVGLNDDQKDSIRQWIPDEHTFDCMEHHMCRD